MAALKNEAFAPELTKLVSTPPLGDAWLHEVKWDGYRIARLAAFAVTLAVTADSLCYKIA